MKKLINKYNYNVSDSEVLRLNKLSILIISICCSFCALLWAGFYYACFGVSLTTLIPLVFVAIVVPSIFISHFIGKYKLLVYAQLTCIVLGPMFVQLSLGTINDSGFVIAWCFLGPLGSLFFLNAKSSIVWMLIFTLGICIAVIGFSPLSSDGAKVTENMRAIFYLVNTVSPFLVGFIASYYFLKNLKFQRKSNVSLLNIAKENNKQLIASLAREKELGKLKSSFVTVASHQFRTPLAVIQSNTELLEMLNNMDKKQEPEKYAKVTNRITIAISKMTDLMDDVLTLGKLTSGKVSCNPEDIDLVDFCEKLTEEFNAFQTDVRSINFVTEGEAYKLRLDPKLLNHSLTNLISNAFKYSIGKENPQFSIHFKPTEVVLSVKDYGLGIPEQEQLHLFEPFFRAENVTEIQGTGLGLSIAKEYVEANKGNIVANSILGEGSCFEVTFKRERL
jgi:signal transduction histidine kinase